jgi:exosome complex component MTR3
MVGVYGPRQAERRDAAYSEEGRLAVDVKVASFGRAARGRFGQSAEERALSAAVAAALEGVVDLKAFPKAVLDVYCTVLEAGGGELAAAVTAAALAVADAGVEMRDVVAACGATRAPGGALLLDPSAVEAAAEAAGLVLAATGGGEIALADARGAWPGATLREAMELCLGGCAQLNDAARACLREAARARAAAAAAAAG